MMYMCGCDAPPSGLVLGGGRKELSTYIPRANRFFRVPLLLTDEYLLTSADPLKFLRYRIISKPDISPISIVLYQARSDHHGKDCLSRLSGTSAMMGCVDEYLAFKDKGTVLSDRFDLACKCHGATETIASVTGFSRYLPVDIGMRL